MRDRPRSRPGPCRPRARPGRRPARPPRRPPRSATRTRCRRAPVGRGGGPDRPALRRLRRHHARALTWLGRHAFDASQRAASKACESLDRSVGEGPCDRIARPRTQSLRGTRARRFSGMGSRSLAYRSGKPATERYPSPGRERGLMRIRHVSSGEGEWPGPAVSREYRLGAGPAPIRPQRHLCVVARRLWPEHYGRVRGRTIVRGGAAGRDPALRPERHFRYAAGAARPTFSGAFRDTRRPPEPPRAVDLYARVASDRWRARPLQARQ